MSTEPVKCFYCGSREIIDHPELEGYLRCQKCKGTFKKKVQEIKKPEEPIIKIVMPKPVETIATRREKEKEIPPQERIDGIKIYPTVLILLPTKNHGKYLEKHLQLYQNLDYPKDKIRMVIVYSPSSDNTLNLSTKFARESDFRVEVYEEPPFKNLRGRSSHWIGDLCNGMKELIEDEKYVLFVDDDITYFPPDFLKKMIDLDLDVCAPYVYLENTQNEFWDTMVFRDLRGRNFSSVNPPFKDLKEPVEVSSAGCCLLYKTRIFQEVPFGNPAPHLTWCNTARSMGYKIFALPFVKILHADVRQERLPWDVKYSGRRFIEKVRKEKIEKKEEIIEYVCSYCEHELQMAPDKKSGYCPECRQTLLEINIQERKIEQIITEWVMEPKIEFEKITRESFKPIYLPASNVSISIFGFTGTGYGGLASVPFYLKKGLDNLKIPNNIFSLKFDEPIESIQEMINQSYPFIFYLHYDRLARVSLTLLRLAKEAGKKVIVFPTDSWMDVNPVVRRAIIRDSWRIVSYADWIKNYSWDGLCKSYREDPSKIIVQRFGVREGRILSKDEKKAVREELHVKTKYLVGEMGFVRPGKGMKYPMLDVLSKIKDLSFLILGSADPINPVQNQFMVELAAVVGKKKLEDRVIWLPRKIEEEEIDKYLGACDFLVCPFNVPTDTSGSFNLSIGIDGGSCIVSSPQRTRREIEEKYEALITSDIQSFPQTIKKLLSSGRIDEVKKNARKYVEQYSWTEFSKGLLKICQSYSRSPVFTRMNNPKVLIATCIKFDTEWQQDCFKRNLVQLKNLDYPKDKLKIVYMCASKKEVDFIKTQANGLNYVTLLDPKEWIDALGNYKKFAVHFYADLFNNMRKEIDDDIEYIFLLDADYVSFPRSILKDLIDLNVDIVSPYLYGENSEMFFDIYGFGKYTDFDPYRPGLYQSFRCTPFWESHDGLVELAYAGTGIQLIRASIFKEIPWVNPDSWLHWCQMAREKGYVVYGAPYIRAYHGTGYLQAGKESRSIFSLIESGDLSIDECIDRGLTTMIDWHRLYKIKYDYITEYYKDLIWTKTLQKWIDEGKCRVETIEGIETLIETGK
jgi:GT2 family glycosyltransferase